MSQVEKERRAPAPELSFNLACFHSQAWQAERESGGGNNHFKDAAKYTRSCLDDTAPSERPRLLWEIATDPFLWPVQGLARKYAEGLD